MCTPLMNKSRIYHRITAVFLQIILTDTFLLLQASWTNKEETVDTNKLMKQFL